MKNFFSTILFSLIFYIGVAQYQIQPEVRSYSVLIEFNNGSGSGFYLNDSLNIYFVTAFHVLFNLENGKLNDDTISLTSYRYNVETDVKNTLKVSLVSALNSGFISIDPKNDIAVVNIASLVKIDTLGDMGVVYKPSVRKMGISTRINGWPITALLKLQDIEAGSDLFIIGYPKSLGLQGRFDLDRPLFRKGIVAGKDFTYHRIIGDAAVYFGNSGGMVIDLKIESGKDPAFRLIGLVSEFIPFNDILYDIKGTARSIDIKNSGYSVIIPVDFILPIIQKIKK